jgi:hypothetical protein
MSDLIRREDAVSRISDLLMIELQGKRLPTWNEVYNAINGIPSAESEQKTFHVIDKTTGKEADPYEIALNEDWAKRLCYCDMEGFAILEDGTLILADECGRFEFIQENDRFEIVWDKVTDVRNPDDIR